MKCGHVQQRWVLTIISAIMIMVKFAAETSYSVTNVAMVNLTERRPNSINDSFGFLNNRTENHEKKRTNAPVYNWSRQMQGYILSAYFLGSLPLQIFGGTIAQRCGGKWVVAASALGTAVVQFLMPLAASGGPYVMMIMCTTHGMIASVIWPGVFAMYGRWIPPQEVSALSAMADIGATFGQFLGLIVSGPICASQTLGGWPTVFYVNGGMFLLVLLFWCILVSNSPEDHPYISTDELHYIQESLKSKQHEVNQAGIPWRRILLSCATTCLIIGSFGFGWIIDMTSTILPQYFSDVLHLPINKISMMISLTAFTKTFALIGCANVFDLIIRRGWLQRTILRKVYVGVGGLACACVFVIIAAIHLNPWTVVSLLIVGMCFYQLPSLTFGVVALDLSPEYSGTLSGIGSVFRDLGGMIMPIVVDSLTTNRSKAEWSTALYLSSAVICISSLFFIIFGTAERQYQWAELSDNDKKDNIVTNEISSLIKKYDSEK